MQQGFQCGYEAAEGGQINSQPEDSKRGFLQVHTKKLWDFLESHDRHVWVFGQNIILTLDSMAMKPKWHFQLKNVFGFGFVICPLNLHWHDLESNFIINMKMCFC